MGEMMVFTDKQKCSSCIHKEVCGIYDFAIRHNTDSRIKFNPCSMADICHHYLKHELVK